MNHIVTQRFIECFDKLKELNKVRSGRQFAMTLDYLPQSFSEILNGRRDVTIDLLRKAVEVYNFNPVYICRGDGSFFYREEGHDSARVLTIVTDPDDNERIVHVPVKAQAGYAGEQLDPVFVSELPAYSLPDYAYRSGTFRSFDVSGDSMEPVLYSKDKVICSFVEQHLWESGIKDHHVYVVVSAGDVLVKRVVNNIRRHRHLELHSDNDYYPPIRMNVNDIREVWMVRTRLADFDHSPPDRQEYIGQQQTDIQGMLRTVEQQSEMISRLQRTIDRLVDVHQPINTL